MGTPGLHFRVTDAGSNAVDHSEDEQRCENWDRPGDQLPTVRQLAVDLRVNANTVARVYGELERAGVLETRRGVGSFIAASRAQARPAQDTAKRLRAFVTRVLSDADRHGFSLEDVLDALEAHRKKNG